MAIAGKVAITLSKENDGKWSADVTYDRLVAVTHNNNLYISRTQSTGIEPPNDTYWFLALQGFGGDDVQALIDQINVLGNALQEIISGAQQVGNAKNLDGHGAEYFAPLSLLTAQKQPTGANLNDYDALGTYFFDGYATDYVNTPDSTAHNGLMIVRRYSNIIAEQQYISINTGKIYTRTGGGGYWREWKEVFTTAGGTIANNTGTPFEISNTTEGANVAFTKYSAGGKELGRMGYQGEGVPTIRVPSGQYYQLLHTGNKPTGSYTGDGGAVARHIATGGIGKVAVVYNVNGIAIVTIRGAMVIHSDGTVKYISMDNVWFDEGTIALATNDSVLNGNGITIEYQIV